MRASHVQFPRKTRIAQRDTVPVVLGPILAICLGLLAACYSPPQPDCGFACKRSGECPTDYFCAPDGICHREGTSPTAPCAIDARIDSPRPIDAPPPDADTTSPSVFETQPDGGSTNVPTNTVIRVQFYEPVGGVNSTSFRVAANTNPVTGTISAIDPTIWELVPAAPLPAGSTIDVDLTQAITDYSGNPLLPFMFSFTTAP